MCDVATLPVILVTVAGITTKSKSPSRSIDTVVTGIPLIYEGITKYLSAPKYPVIAIPLGLSLYINGQSPKNRFI